MIDKDIEKIRYDKRAELLLNTDRIRHLEKSKKYLNTPYEHYFKVLKEQESCQSKLLEIGAGMGENTEPLVDMTYEVCATDISPKSVKLIFQQKLLIWKNYLLMTKVLM